MINIKIDISICGNCPFASITKRKFNKPSDGFCHILRSMYIDNIPINLEENSLNYPSEYRKELVDEANGSKFKEIPNNCPYRFSRLEEV